MLGRRFVMDSLAQWGVSDDGPDFGLRDSALMATGELLANAAKFADGDMVIALDAHRGHLDITVRDNNPREAFIAQAGVEADSGRGLAVVAALSKGWGQRRYDGHKDMWCQLEVPEGSALANGCTT